MWTSPLHQSSRLLVCPFSKSSRTTRRRLSTLAPLAPMMLHASRFTRRAKSPGKTLRWGRPPLLMSNAPASPKRPLSKEGPSKAATPSRLTRKTQHRAMTALLATAAMARKGVMNASSTPQCAPRSRRRRCASLAASTISRRRWRPRGSVSFCGLTTPKPLRPRPTDS